MPGPFESKRRPNGYAEYKESYAPTLANPDPVKAGSRLESAPHHTTPAPNAPDFMFDMMEGQLDLILETVAPEDRW